MIDFEVLTLLAQDEEPGWSKLLYLLIFFVFPVLNSLGEKIREWSNRKADATTGEGRKIKAPAAPKGPAKSLRPAPPVVIPGEPHRPAPIRPPVAPKRATAKHVPRATPVAPPRPARPKRATPVVPRAIPVRPAQGSPVTVSESPRPQPIASPKPLGRQERSSAVAGWVRQFERTDEKSRSPRDRPPHALLPSVLDPKTARMGIIMSEILGPPLALREERSPGIG